MNEPNSKSERPNPRRFSQEQYDMLKRCSDKKDMTEWNEYRKKHLYEKIWLQCVELTSAHLEHANLGEAHLERANLACANLLCAHLYEANLKSANLDMANLQSALLQGSNLQGAFIPLAHLEGADLIQANLQDARLVGANLQGTILREANLEGANFETATVDGGTLIWNCKVSRYSKNKSFTNFEGVGLDSARIDPGTKQLLEYNIRRKNWEDWYPKQHHLLAWFVRRFWEISDYGISTKGIVKTFFKWALVFAIVYYVLACIDYYLVGIKDYPGIVSNLFVLENSKQAVSGWLVPLRAVYFSIVTMTTLGFGDMYANANSLFRGIFGHILLAFQVILGYVLLGALVTRFAVLFTAGGPAGKFTNEKEKKDKKK
jgi:uncharacterized protein YjbI with pentapeptide repeats